MRISSSYTQKYTANKSHDLNETRLFHARHIIVTAFEALLYLQPRNGLIPLHSPDFVSHTM